jgi:hypothetical protein
MGDRASEVLKLTIIIIACIAVIALGFTVFNITKFSANMQTTSLVSGMSNISNMSFNSLNQNIVNGATVKSSIKEFQPKDVSIIIITKNLLAAELNSLGLGLQNEATASGNYVRDLAENKVPLIVLDNFALKTAQGTEIANPVGVNFGAILKNTVLDYDGENYASLLTDGSISFVDYNDSTEYGQTISYKDGGFITKLEFLTQNNNRILRYDIIGDFNKKGSTLYIDDNALFGSYLLRNTANDIIGVVFVQQ